MLECGDCVQHDDGWYGTVCGIDHVDGEVWMADVRRTDGTETRVYMRNLRLVEPSEPEYIVVLDPNEEPKDKPEALHHAIAMAGIEQQNICLYIQNGKGNLFVEMSEEQAAKLVKDVQGALRMLVEQRRYAALRAEMGV